MAKKKDVAGVKKEFENRLSGLWQYFDQIENHILRSTISNKDTLIAELSEQTFVAAAVAFEAFMTDLFVAYINKKSSKFSGWIEQNAQKAIRDSSVKGVADFLNINIPSSLNVHQVEKLLIPDNDNVKFGSAQDIIDKAKKWLDVPYCDLFKTLREDDRRLIDAVKKLRNYLAHRSDRGKAAMNLMLTKVETTSGRCRNAGLGRTGSKKIDDVGAYLRASYDGERRVIIYLHRLHVIARHFE